MRGLAISFWENPIRWRLVAGVKERLEVHMGGKNASRLMMRIGREIRLLINRRQFRAR